MQAMFFNELIFLALYRLLDSTMKQDKRPGGAYFLSHDKEEPMELGLKDKIALITGGSIGIGLAVAEGLAAEGVHVALCARDVDRLGEAARRIKTDYAVQVLALPADLSKVSEINRLVRELNDEFGGLDILINNAGIGSNETVMTAPDQKWQYYWELHVMAAVRLACG